VERFYACILGCGLITEVLKCISVALGSVVRLYLPTCEIQLLAEVYLKIWLLGYRQSCGPDNG
jgi:hypothetical protein